MMCVPPKTAEPPRVVVRRRSGNRNTPMSMIMQDCFFTGITSSDLASVVIRCSSLGTSPVKMHIGFESDTGVLAKRMPKYQRIW